MSSFASYAALPPRRTSISPRTARVLTHLTSPRTQALMICFVLSIGMSFPQAMRNLDLPEFMSSHEIPSIRVNAQVSTHLLFSEPITFVDISTDLVIGDLAQPNVLRLKAVPTPDSPYNDLYDQPVSLEDRANGLVSTQQPRYQPSMPLKARGERNYSRRELGIVTIVTQSYMTQYVMVESNPQMAMTVLRVSKVDGLDLIDPQITMTSIEMKNAALQILTRPAGLFAVKAKESRVEMKLRNIYTVGDYFFLDVEVFNRSKIQYQVDQLRFKVKDKKITKSANAQDVELKPDYVLYEQDRFGKRYRNVYAFRRFTFPDRKVFSIELSEDQISGRKVEMTVDYKDVLNALTL